MNRTVIMGVAIFFALVGIAMMSGESKAVAGHGCHGCGGSAGCDGAPACCGPVANDCCGAAAACCGPVADCCGAPADCCGRKHQRKKRCGGGGLFSRKNRCGGNSCGGDYGCGGASYGCHGGGGYGCAGGGVIVEPHSVPTPPPAEASTSTNGRVVFRTASFRR